MIKRRIFDLVLILITISLVIFSIHLVKMFERFRLLILFIVGFIIITWGELLSHDFWIEKKEEKFYILSGHENSIEGYDPKRVVKWIILDKKGKKIINRSVIRDKELAYFEDKDNKIGLLCVFFDNKYWVKTAEGWKNFGKLEAEKMGLQIIESGRSYKFAKYLNFWNENFIKPLYTELEIIPLNNPFNSDNLKIRVLLKGKPLPNAPIFINASHEEKMKTDSDGIALINLKEGLNIISVTTKIPLKNDPYGELLYLRASLSFVK